jgi:hypothetical protein
LARSALHLPAVILSLLVFIHASSAAGQAPGYAEIAFPSDGEGLAGIVTIIGTANHPAFASYELTFAYQDDPTATWFLLSEPVTTPVLDDRLGLWDTTAISAGVYQLRLRVNLEDGRFLQAVVPNLRIGEPASPTADPARPGRFTPLPEGRAPETAPSATPPVVAEMNETRATPAWTALQAGGIGGATLVVLLGAYTLLIPQVRLYLARRQHRRLHRRGDWSRRSRRRR